ncbi:hypothetical protein R1sor_013397 [Riccia sorocarpa]|uniref:Zinc finger PHD-type domain-containing protein n=1 Tax=Riccia sorocarpa TaxID=122646 RepID=A0ABD3H6J0_9MARC
MAAVEGTTSAPPPVLLRRSPRPKMKASRGRTTYPRLLAPVNLPIQPVTQIPPKLTGPDVPAAPSPPASEPSPAIKVEIYDDPEICTFCDDGGQSILTCEGICHRHFHAKKEDVAEAIGCRTLKYTTNRLENIEKFVCDNCKRGSHQCFICGKLGVSRGEQPEVYLCGVTSCRKLYHPDCILKHQDIPEADQYVKRITNGTMKLHCPRHRCDTCKTEDMTPGQLVQCRRCPRAWHNDCLKDFERSGELPTTVIWEHDNYKYIYCRNHVIIPTIQAPKRDHVRFPRGKFPVYITS